MPAILSNLCLILSNLRHFVLSLPTSSDPRHHTKSVNWPVFYLSFFGVSIPKKC